MKESEEKVIDKPKKPSSTLREMTKEEKLNLIKLILNSDVRSIRKTPISSVNLNFLFPSSLIGLKFDKELTPLILCCYIGKLEIFNYLLTNDEINVNMSSTPCLFSPLMIACYKGFYEIVRELLERHADINHKNSNGQAAFIFCFSRLEVQSFKYENKKICLMLVELLLSYGADVNSKFDLQKESSVIMKLVSVDINNQEKCETTCDVIKFLIERGADINYRNKDKLNVFNIIQKNNKILPKYKEEIYSVLKTAKRLNTLLLLDNEEEYLNIPSEDNNNYNLLAIYSSKHTRYKSINLNFNNDLVTTQNHLKDLRNNLFKKDQLILQTIDNNASSCCQIF